MHPIIEKYGKQLITDLLDVLIIDKKISDQQCYDIMLKHNFITRRTKIVLRRYTHFNNSGYNHLSIFTKTKQLVNFEFYDSHLPQILEELN